LSLALTLCLSITDACTKWTQRMPGVKNQFTSSARQHKLKKTSSRLHKGVSGSQCVRSEDCSPAHCCARHLWTRVCKAEPRKGEACSAPLQNKDSHRVELFQRCLCTSSLSSALRTCQEL
uniref:Dickkopf-related protein 1/2/4 C-terminal subdomain 1 domain-containing protein n=1 Tax=Electrophorus electricus TaxID=8005 RepID=A0A4W4GQA6_ELEEL